MAETHRLIPFAAALALAVVHLMAGKLTFLSGTPRHRWLSAAGGISLAYVFLHLLPELARGEEHVRAAAGTVAGVAERHTYLVALIGLCAFYGLERMAVRSRGEGSGTTAAVFWIHISSFALYNALIGYLLVREERSQREFATFALAMALHFVVNDFALREHHRERYDRTGRWVVAAALVLGWAAGAATEVSEAAVAVIVAFLGGGVILNVLKEELPDERESRFGALALGMAAYAAILIAG